ncbi:BCCT family transporter [Paraoerskovia marina]|uniref:Choline/glycine/proline betaine transport protein n=1 Tax=Paraoerskovia marina TaxID=545619 RepID=A0A1H1UQ63_9CELL|nr:BCCT family transporter [Paraoerskovia marina]SDS74617.1 choline/glycine/proline betaine transport protein [Paraoerskovia marina]
MSDPNSTPDDGESTQEAMPEEAGTPATVGAAAAESTDAEGTTVVHPEHLSEHPAHAADTAVLPGEPVGSRKGIHSVAPRVFYPAAGLILVFVLVTMIFTDTMESVMATLQADVVGAFGWYYILLVAVFVAVAIWMGVSRFGDIVLAKDGDEKPDFSMPAWFAMLFATGMGIGLVYWGVAEPLSHYISPKPGVEGSQAELAQQAMAQSYLHWGVHAWAIYVIIGLALAYAIHRKGRPVSIRWALEPLFGDRVKGRLGDAIDVIAIIGTVFGVATSLGFGVIQISAGLGFVGLATPGTALQIGLIAGITAVATLSVVSGVGKGIKWLSNGNMVAAAFLLVVVLVLGPTLFLLQDFVQSIGYYLANVLQMTFDNTAYQGEAGQEWQASWTTFYWGWWISWAPFVGVFIARISKGRTVREFVGGTLLVPTAVTFLWFSIMGGSALYRQMFTDNPLVAEGESVNTDTALFQLIGDLPGGPVWVGLAIILIALFFVTSSDSGSFVVDMLASGGDPNPPIWSRIFWAITEGLVAASLLLAGSGGLGALQTAAILIALPFSFVMIGMLFALIKAFREEHNAILRAERKRNRRLLTEHVTEQVTEHVSEQLDDYFDSQPRVTVRGTARRLFRRRKA